MLDYRKFVDMESYSFRGKTSEEIANLLSSDSKRVIEIEYFIKSLDSVLGKYFDSK